MKVKIITKDHKLNLRLPTSFLMLKIFQKKIIKKTEMCKETKQKFKKIYPYLLKLIKQYKKEHGNFSFIEVEEKDATVLIEI